MDANYARRKCYQSLLHDSAVKRVYINPEYQGERKKESTGVQPVGWLYEELLFFPIVGE